MSTKYLVRDYLIHSYLYYEQDVSLITDHEFNAICQALLDNYDNINHRHKHLISLDNLKANTGYDIQYPLIIKHLAFTLYKERTGVYPDEVYT